MLTASVLIQLPVFISRHSEWQRKHDQNSICRHESIHIISIYHLKPPPIPIMILVPFCWLGFDVVGNRTLYCPHNEQMLNWCRHISIICDLMSYVNGFRLFTNHTGGMHYAHPTTCIYTQLGWQWKYKYIIEKFNNICCECNFPGHLCDRYVWSVPVSARYTNSNNASYYTLWDI